MPRSEDPPEVAVVVARLEAFKEQLNSRLTDIHTEVREVHDEVKATNSRVTSLEADQKVAKALEARNVTDKDSTMKLLLLAIAVGSGLSPVVLHFIK